MPYDKHFQRKYLLLNMINHLGPVSRTALIDHTDYRPATVGAIVGELLKEGLIVETGSISTGHGRKRVLLEINKQHLCAIGVSFTSTNVTFILSQFDGQILHQSEMAVCNKRIRKDMVWQILEHVQQILSQYSHAHRIVGIGICKPLYDPTDSQRPDTQNPTSEFFDSWIHNDLQPLLEANCHLPIRVFSGVTTPAIAEHRFGVAKNVDNFIWIELSNGIGTSIFCNGSPVNGANGVAGELGHTVIRFSEDQPLCYCGKPGCVETASAWPALLKNIQKSLDDNVYSVLQTTGKPFSDLTVQDIRQALDAGDRMCRHYVKQSAKRIGVAISNAINLLNPEMIVLYGFMLELGDYFLEQLEKAIRDNVISFACNFSIKISTSSESIMPLGAIAELFASYLHMDDYKWVYQLQPVEAGQEALNP